MGMDTELCSVVLQRWDVVDSLREGPKDKRALVAGLDCSRSTVDRAVRDLESMGVIEYADGKHAVTPLGETVAADLEGIMETVELRRELEPFLEWIPDGEFDLPLEHLSSGELWLPEPGDPWAMVNRHVTVLSEAEDIRCVLPLIGLHAYEVVYERIVDDGGRAEVVVTPDVARTLRTDPAYADMTAELATIGRYRVLQYDGPIPYFVGSLTTPSRSASTRTASPARCSRPPGRRPDAGRKPRSRTTPDGLRPDRFVGRRRHSRVFQPRGSIVVYD